MQAVNITAALIPLTRECPDPLSEKRHISAQLRNTTQSNSEGQTYIFLLFRGVKSWTPTII